jgi:EAL domain-containing protein (putative c-di-GMP-specific phosphodiesterase class I)
MENIEKIERFIVGKHDFLKDDNALQYKFLLINSMLLAGFLTAMLASVIRFFISSYFIATIDMLLSISLLGLFVFLRRKKERFEFVATISLFLLFFIFTALLVLLENEQIKLMWYPLLIVATFMIKGYKTGLKVLAIVVFTIVFLQINPYIDIYLENRDVLLSISAYISLGLLMTLSELQQNRNIKSIKENSKKIDKHQKLLYVKSRRVELTKLPNKIVLNEDIKDSKGDISCLVLDIDDFDVIVHEFGDLFADHLIKAVAKKLKLFCSKDISLYHIDGSRFAFLLKNSTNKSDIEFAKSIQTIYVEYQKIELTINFIIAIVREKLNTLSHANMTLSEIKNGDLTQCKVYEYDEKKDQLQKNNLYWAKRLGELIKDDKIVVYYQPIVDNRACKIVKYESLVRAIDGDNVVTPYFFLSVAKSKGLLKDITKIVIEKSFKNFSKNSFDFSINITEQDLKEDYLVDFLSLKAKEYGIDPKRVFLEVLENINSEDSSYANTQFEKLRELGFSLAIDDFGAEASNLSRLLTLRADLIKIDGQFIKNLDSDLESIKIVETIVSLAQKMDVKTVAEFVHNEEIYNIVKKLGVDFSQGYYFSPPLPQVVKESTTELEKLCA